ncbi:TRAP transporter small permease [Azospirillum picis]|uniref:TRAP transporter small permease protein n=1 Tax=Azospirillum picis TaxID=488438 RepID=A0ABU0MMU4_9PROT|nr:TRAP transporter small permease [Azospirillum picis]MBP2301245.1 TRAP-type C4-dicarboxylate transport system permease small subunit [Azospirillum picis]MDQ0534792.1 TRAP-type C4-dicarboxylate transport system permease small subunit [Azospirillum picis]
MTKLVEAYFKLLKLLMALCLAGMVVLVFGNVVLRYGFNSGITASEEVSRLLFVWLCFIGAVVGLRERAHLGVDTLVARLPRAGRIACAVLSYGMMLYITGLILQGSWAQTVINLEVWSPATGMSMALVYGVGVVFGVSTGAILLHELYRVLTGKATDADLLMVAESEDLPEDAAHDLHTGGHRTHRDASPLAARTASSR